MFGDFEDLETGEVHHGDDVSDGEKDDGNEGSEGEKRDGAEIDVEKTEGRLQKKKQLKAAFNAKYPLKDRKFNTPFVFYFLFVGLR